MRQGLTEPDSSQQSETVVPTALVISKRQNGDKRALHIFGINQKIVDDNDEMESSADNTSILNNVKTFGTHTEHPYSVSVKAFETHTEHPYPVSIVKVKHKEKDEQDSASFEMPDCSLVKENVICSNNFYCTRPTSLLEEFNGNTSKEKESLYTSTKPKPVTDIPKTVLKTEIKTELDDEQSDDSMSQEPCETWVKNEENGAMYSVFKCA
ncbi:uncharacterized protein LOC131932450 isoform X2 [Physella acuta]|uniref:uncharacterized protein LOC131932450 isoform X2 n=1 Tax=Physella acuta TaxID=109671 RepID=UPI0027DC9E76|nr:uncharacterized protein LOC131932450 isoform X2 [Physella acuta]